MNPDQNAAAASEWVLLPWVLAAAFLFRAAFGLYTQTTVNPDEIYQYLEQAHRLVFHWGFIPWEFQHGARSWLIPGAIATILKACALIGLGSPDIYQPAVKLVLCAVSTTLPLSIYRIGRATLAEAGARVGLIGTAVWYELINVAARPLPDALAAYALFGALAVLVSPPRKHADIAFGALAGLALALRVEFFPAVAAMLAVAALTKRGRVGAVMIAFAAVVVAAGALDAVTLGEWFGSVIETVRYNIVEGMARTFGVAPPYGYLVVIAADSCGLAVLGVLGLAVSARTTWRISLPLLLQLAAFSVISHKEPRFVIFIAPLWLLGLGGFFVRPQTWRTAAATLAIAAISLLGLLRLLPDEPEFYPHGLLAQSDVRQAYLELARRDDVTGLIDASGADWTSTGGYYDFNQPVPIYRPDIPATEFGQVIRTPGLYADYWLGKGGGLAPAGFGDPERVGTLTLWRRVGATGSALAPPGYSTRLPDFAAARRPRDGAAPRL
jgi:hypothetical protein